MTFSSQIRFGSLLITSSVFYLKMIIERQHDAHSSQKMSERRACVSQPTTENEVTVILS